MFWIWYTSRVSNRTSSIFYTWMISALLALKAKKQCSLQTLGLLMLEKESTLLSERTLQNWPFGLIQTNWVTMLINDKANHFGRGWPKTIVRKDQMLVYNSTCKYLGLHIDPVLSFRAHIDQVGKKLNQFCELAHHMPHFYPIKCLIMFYISFAKTIIMYGLLIHEISAKIYSRKINNVQRRILRSLFFRKRKRFNSGNIVQKQK